MLEHPLFVPVLSGLFAFAGTWGALKVKLAWLTAEVKRAHERLDRVEAPFFQAPRQARGGKPL